MHIAEGVLSAPVLIAGAAAAAAGIAVGLKRLDESRLMTAGLVGAAFFIASLIHVPIGVSSAHLLLCGLVGVMLGVSAYPVIFTALLLQGVLFEFGGLTVLGVNTTTMGTGALAAGMLFHALVHPGVSRRRLMIAGALAGAAGVLIAALMTACALAFSSEGFVASATALLAAHVPIMAAEAVITALVVDMIARTYPELLHLGEVKRGPCEHIKNRSRSACAFALCGCERTPREYFCLD